LGECLLRLYLMLKLLGQIRRQPQTCVQHGQIGLFGGVIDLDGIPAPYQRKSIHIQYHNMVACQFQAQVVPR